MKYDEMKNKKVDLAPIGGQLVSIGDLVDEMRRSRRDRFMRLLFATEEGKKNGWACFDAIGFLAATEEFEHYFDVLDGNYEGSITYDVIAGGDWVWHCKTTITWQDTYPIVYGNMHYETSVVENEKVNSRINAMSGTAMEIHVLKKNLKLISNEEALERTRRANCK